MHQPSPLLLLYYAWPIKCLCIPNCRKNWQFFSAFLISKDAWAWEIVTKEKEHFKLFFHDLNFQYLKWDEIKENKGTVKIVVEMKPQKYIVPQMDTMIYYIVSQIDTMDFPHNSLQAVENLIK